MLELSLLKLKGVFGGCYCLKYPFRYINRLNPDILIGEQVDKSTCEDECDLEENRMLGYFAYSDCIYYIKTEGRPTSRFLERAERLDNLRFELGITDSR